MSSHSRPRTAYMDPHVLSPHEVKEEIRFLRDSDGDCDLCFSSPSSLPKSEWRPHVLLPSHQQRYLSLPYMADLRLHLFCVLCNKQILTHFRVHVEGRRHQQLAAAMPPALHPAHAPSSAHHTPPPSYATAAGQPPPRPAVHSPYPTPPKAKPSPSHPPPSPASSSFIQGNLCQLCHVRISPSPLPPPDRVSTHLRGVQHRTRLAVQEKQWDGDRSIAALQATASARGISCHLQLAGQPVRGRDLVLEAGHSYPVDVMITVTGNPVHLNSVHVVPPLTLPGFTWRGDRVQLPPGQYRCSTQVQPTLADVSTARTLIVCCFSGGLTVAIPADVVVCPAGGTATRELLKPSTAYVPKERVLPSSTHARYTLIKGERPSFARTAMELFVKKLEWFTIPSAVSGALTEADLRQRLIAELTTPMSPLTHTQRFQQLLWLEELQMQSDIQMYDAYAPLTRDSSGRGLLQLSVPGLAEARPSVLYGDHLLVSDSPFTDVTNALTLLNRLSGSSPAPRKTVFSGYVHRVSLDSVALHFHRDFLDRHWVAGKSFYVRFTFGRTPLRRCHQALSLLDANISKRFFPAIQPSTTYVQTRTPAVPGVYPFLTQWRMTVTTSPAECDQWLREHIFKAGARPTAIGLDTEFEAEGDQLQVMVLLQLATADACLLYWLRDKEALTPTLTTLLRFDGVRKYVVGHRDNAYLLEKYGVHLEGSVDVQRRVQTWLDLDFTPGLDKLVNAFRPDLPYCKDRVMQRSRFTWPLTEGMREYAASDAVLTLLVGERLSAMKPHERTEAWMRLESGAALREGVVVSEAPGDEEKRQAAAAAPVAALPAISFFNRALNGPQQDAVRGICAGLHHPFPYILYGPPGTGKTTVVVECIAQLVKRPNTRVLACAPSNSAADLIAQRMSVSLDPTTLYRLNAVSRGVDSISPGLIPYCSVEAGQCTLLPSSALTPFKLIVSTCISAATLYALGCQPGLFTHIIIDEAGHATEPEALSAIGGLIDPKATRVVLAGDPQQLGPIIRSPLALKHGLAMSLLERLLADHQANTASPYHRDATHPFPAQYITKLLLNYRSHPAILETPNRLFYDGELIASADRLSRESLQRWPVFPVQGFPLLVHHLVGKEDREGQSPSWFNALEAQTVVEYIAQLLAYRQGAVSLEDVAVITPYRKQVQKIRTLLRHRFPAVDCSALKVGSVEEFQGQERRVILLSTVRSQLLSYESFDVRFQLGFVGHPKRLNVAITRAKCALIIVGNALLLRTDPNWAQVIEHCHSKGAVVGGYQPEKAPEMGQLPAGNPAMEELTRLLSEMAAMNGEVAGGVKVEEKEGEEDDGGDEVHVNEEPSWKRDD